MPKAIFSGAGGAETRTLARWWPTSYSFLPFYASLTRETMLPGGRLGQLRPSQANPQPGSEGGSGSVLRDSCPWLMENPPWAWGQLWRSPGPPGQLPTASAGCRARPGPLSCLNPKGGSRPSPGPVQARRGLLLPWSLGLWASPGSNAQALSEAPWERSGLVSGDPGSSVGSVATV